MAPRIPQLFGFGGVSASGMPRPRDVRGDSSGVSLGSLAFLAAAGLVGAVATGSLFAAGISLYAHLVRPVAARVGTPPMVSVPPSGATGAAGSPVDERAVSPPRWQPATARASVRATPTLSVEDIARAIGRGDALLRGGEVEAARFFFQLAADAGDRQAALRLGEAFDPALLPDRDGRGDRRAARYWYERALALGEADAASRIAQLDARLPH